MDDAKKQAEAEDVIEGGEPAGLSIFDDPFRLFDEWASPADCEAHDGRGCSE